MEHREAENSESLEETSEPEVTSRSNKIMNFIKNIKGFNDKPEEGEEEEEGSGRDLLKKKSEDSEDTKDTVEIEVEESTEWDKDIKIEVSRSISIPEKLNYSMLCTLHYMKYREAIRRYTGEFRNCTYAVCISHILMVFCVILTSSLISQHFDPSDPGTIRGNTSKSWYTLYLENMNNLGLIIFILTTVTSMVNLYICVNPNTFMKIVSLSKWTIKFYFVLYPVLMFYNYSWNNELQGGNPDNIRAVFNIRAYNIFGYFFYDTIFLFIYTFFLIFFNLIAFIYRFLYAKLLLIIINEDVKTFKVIDLEEISLNVPNINMYDPNAKKDPENCLVHSKIPGFKITISRFKKPNSLYFSFKYFIDFIHFKKRGSYDSYQYVGQLNSEYRPHGFGFWNSPNYHGELLMGFWESGLPLSPFKSREVGTSAGFSNVIIGWVRYEGGEGSVGLGVAAAECCVSGPFFRTFPRILRFYTVPETDGKRGGRVLKYLGDNTFFNYNKMHNNMRNQKPKEEKEPRNTEMLTTLLNNNDIETYKIYKNSPRHENDARHHNLESTFKNKKNLFARLFKRNRRNKNWANPANFKERMDSKYYCTDNHIVMSLNEVSNDIVGYRYGNVDSYLSGERNPYFNVLKKMHIRDIFHDINELFGVKEKGIPLTTFVNCMECLLNALTLHTPNFSPIDSCNLTISIDDTKGINVHGYVLEPKINENGEQEFNFERCKSVTINLNTIKVAENKKTNLELEKVDKEHKLGEEEEGEKNAGYNIYNILNINGWVKRENVKSLEAWIYIHGFNVKCMDTLGIFAQIISFGNYPQYIKPFVFSWPNGNKITQFKEAIASSTCPKTVDTFIRMLQALLINNIRDVHIMTHSMGATMFLGAFSQILNSKEYCNLFLPLNDQDPLHHNKLKILTVTLLNPFYPVYDFIQNDYPRLKQYCNHITIYSDVNDKALKIAELITGKKRLGRCVNELYTLEERVNENNNRCTLGSILLPFTLEEVHKMRKNKKNNLEIIQNRKKKHWLDVDVIDTTCLGSNVHSLRHSYWFLNREVIEDLRDLIVNRKRAQDRSSRLDRSLGNTWVYRVAPSNMDTLYETLI